MTTKTRKPTRTKQPDLAYGYQPDGTWLFGDCIIGSDGAVEPEEHIIPGLFAPRLLTRRPPNIEPRHATEVLRVFVALLEHSVGPVDARRAIGMALSYVAAPYLLMNRREHPGLWLHGVRACGKTVIARWLAQIFGLGQMCAIRVGDSTCEGLSRSLRQYCCLPVTLDEYRAGRVAFDKETVLRGAADRGAGFNAVADSKLVSRRDASLTSPIVCGEKPSVDAATRCRYLHIQPGLAGRLSGGDLHAMTAILVQQLHLIGLALLKRHADFGGQVVEAVADNPVDRTTYATALADASFETAARLIAQ